MALTNRDLYFGSGFLFVRKPHVKELFDPASLPYQKANPEKILAHIHNRRALKKSFGRHTGIDVSRLLESPLDPEAIAEARKIVAGLITLIDKGEVDQISVYVGRRDGSYQTMQNRNNGRHEDAGRLLEMAVLRLGFMQREDIVDLINED